MAEPCYPRSDYLSGCGWHDWRDDFRIDCFYYTEDKDMGATVPWCKSKIMICEPQQCNGCQNFISKAEVHDVVSHILEERMTDNGN